MNMYATIETSGNCHFRLVTVGVENVAEVPTWEAIGAFLTNLAYKGVVEFAEFDDGSAEYRFPTLQTDKEKILQGLKWATQSPELQLG